MKRGINGALAPKYLVWLMAHVGITVAVFGSGCGSPEAMLQPDSSGQLDRSSQPNATKPRPPSLEQVRNEVQGIWLQEEQVRRDEAIFGPNNRPFFALFISHRGVISYLDFVILYEQGRPSDVSFTLTPIAQVTAVDDFRAGLDIDPSKEWATALRRRHPGTEFRFACGAYEAPDPEAHEHPALELFVHHTEHLDSGEIFVSEDKLYFRRTSFENLRKTILANVGGQS